MAQSSEANVADFTNECSNSFVNSFNMSKEVASLRERQVALGTLKRLQFLVNGSHAGPINVNSAGTLQGSGNIGGLVTVAAGGILAPGNSPGALTVGSLALSAGSQTQIELGGTTRGTEYDAVLSTNAAALGGALGVSSINGFG